MIDNSKLVLLAAGAVIGLIIVKKNFPGAIADAAAGAVGVIGEAVGGVVIGVGDVLGVPRTDETECERAMREGRTLDASFACPAGTWLKYVWNKV